MAIFLVRFMFQGVIYAWSIIAHLKIRGEALSGRDLVSPNNPNSGLCSV